MAGQIDLKEKPESKTLYMICGWRQWADAGSVSSGLPKYLIQQTRARHIGSIKSDGFYIFQIPGTHSLVRPTVQFEDGYPKSLEVRRNDIYFTGDEERGVIIFLGDEPHMSVDTYVDAMLVLRQINF